MPTGEIAKPGPLQIPLPGGSGPAPTGAVQFRDDWPGLFVRGDTAVALAFGIRQLEKRLADHPDPVVWTSLTRLIAIAAIVEREVQVR